MLLFFLLLSFLQLPQPQYLCLHLIFSAFMSSLSYGSQNGCHQSSCIHVYPRDNVAECAGPDTAQVLLIFLNTQNIISLICQNNIFNLHTVEDQNIKFIKVHFDINFQISNTTFQIIIYSGHTYLYIHLAYPLPPGTGRFSSGCRH